ncbi:hypothetical protein [Haloarchaeobius sp. HRN-SO-5]|uniref:hypothetical protein n=1 Tax=Haloarchaeobius sp. HRN-SO-5 TaxID=3446118 RepID=UPI003EB7D2A0
MSRRNHVLVSLSLALLVSLAGCATFTGSTDGGAGAGAQQGAEIRNDVVNEMESVESYNFSMVTTVSFGENEQVTESNGTVNVTAQRMVTESVTTVRTNSSQSKLGSTTYVFGDQQCLNLGGDWDQSTVDRSPWRTGANMSVQQELLNQSDARLYNDTLDGEDVYVIEVRPSQEAIQSLLAGSETDVEFQDVTYRQYVDREDERLLRSTMNATYYVSGRQANLSVTMTFSDYNTTEPIELPASAVGTADDPGPCYGMTTANTTDTTDASVYPAL